MSQFSPFFSCTTDSERQQWLKEHCPARSDALISALWAEAARREQEAPQTVQDLIAGAHALANVWQAEELSVIALRIEASMYRALGEHTRALETYQAAVERYHQLGLTDEAVRTTVGQLDTLMYLGDYEQALHLAEMAISKIRLIGDDAVLGRLLVNQGNIYARSAKYLVAQQAYAEARQLFAQLDQPQHVAMVEANEANVLTNLNDFRQAEALYSQARRYFVTTDLAGAVAQVDHNLAYLAFAQGDYQLALQRFAEARAFFAAQQSPVDLAYVDLYRAEIYLALNLWPEALATARHARPIFEQALMQWEVAQLWLVEAAALGPLGEASAVAAALTHADQLFSAQGNLFWVAVTAVNRALLLWRQKDLRSAQQLLLDAEETFTTAGALSRATQCAIWLGRLALVNDEDTAATQHFQRGLAMLGDIPLPAITYACHEGLARIHQRRGEIDDAIRRYTLAVTALEQAQATIGAEDYKMAYRRDKLPIYEALILLYLEQNTAEATRAAFALVERAKSRTLLDTMARVGEQQGGNMPDDLVARYEALKRELHWAYHQLQAPAQEADQNPDQQRGWHGLLRQHEASLAELWAQWHHPDLIATPRNPLWTVSSTAMQQTLAPNTLLLEFYATEEAILLFALTADQLWTHRLSLTRSALAHLLEQLRFQMNKFTYGEAYRNRHAEALLQSTNELLYQLYQQLLAPLLALHSAEHLIIVPHGLLHDVPFHALWQGEHYLVDRYTLSYAPSATVLHQVMTTAPIVPSDPPLILGVTDPTIPYVASEVTGLQELFPAAQAYLGEQATVAKLLTGNQRPSFLHISTHALFRHDNPTFSALKLADSWLTVNEISTLATAAPLVTLSACETGQHEVGLGDELMGLCRGFFGIGAQSLLVSLWRVEDRSTADLMLYFYQNLQKGHPVHEALRDAQLTIKERHPHPYYWAPFVLMGNPALRLGA